MLRRLPGSLGLGLLASLVAHATCYGSSHVEGGALHDTFFSLAVATLVGFLFGAVSLGLATGRNVVDGTILAQRAAQWRPSILAISLASVGWFALGEACEPIHALVPSLVALCWLVVASLLLGVFFGSALRALARAVATCRRPAVAPRATYRAITTQRLFLARRLVCTRFAGRAPPVALAR